MKIGESKYQANIWLKSGAFKMVNAYSLETLKKRYEQFDFAKVEVLKIFNDTGVTICEVVETIK